MAVKSTKQGFTLVELLTVLAIIAMLVGLLLPALAAVRNMARETKQKAQFATIDVALTAFRNDQGYYPPSSQRDETGAFYCGAQKLAEALLGWDLMGFHPQSAWRADGLDINGGELAYDPARIRGDDSLYERRDLYLQLATTSAFRLGDLFTVTAPLEPFPFVLCDVFGVKKITLGPGNTVSAGTPILYYRANTSNKKMNGLPPFEDQIYNHLDNMPLIILGKLPKPDPVNDPHELGKSAGQRFYSIDYKIIDPKMTIPWPYRPDSYILISAGADGEYGTNDDICNFGN